ncbi:glycosyltransferase involved in cell wall biosynthesis [Microbacterium phyllosphaerae]|uniref:D-inositol 3-phosphate glycosyltransferase n=1 Tax=Microbacterium phyllosphaerae TaxID=124798 RepID=A0ABS4WSH7_9MICO|nr:glycosyltransferase [Microbacterium phyllosphaerae]MBP2378908.1 glycosyltransferase involved in cell wall biosynthesis [Microbacterium phyllosphaerae]
MRIAMVTDYYLPTLGGVQTVIKAHREALEHAGHEVFVFAPLAERSADPHVVRLPTARGFAPDGYPFTWTPSAAAAALRDGLSARGIQIVHVHTEMFAALAGFEAARTLGIPIVQTMHGRIDVYTRSVLPIPSVTTMILAAMHRRRLSHDRAQIDSTAAYASTRMAQRMWRLMVSQANHADHVIVPSAHFAAKLVAQGVQTPLTVLSNGLESSVLARVGSPTPRVVAPGDELRVVWCGRLSPEKRPQVFVDALRQSPGVRAEMFGDGVARRAVAAAASDLASGRLTVRGGVPQSQVLDGMRQAHVLVSTSLDFDNQPMVILEAIASGLPVIVTDPDLAEMLPEGGGVVTETPDAAGLAATLRTLRDDPTLITSMSAAAISHRSQVAQDTHRDALLDVYRAALSSAR